MEQANGFLTQLEHDSATEEARRRDLIYQHVSVIAPSNWGGGKPRGGNRCGNRRGRGLARGSLRHLSSVPTSRQQDATPAATTSAKKPASPAKSTSTSPPSKGTKVVAAITRVAEGTKCNVECVCLLVFAKGAQLPYPSLLPTPFRWGAGFLTSRTDGSRLSVCHHGTYKLWKGCLSTGSSLSQTTSHSTRLFDSSRAARNG